MPESDWRGGKQEERRLYWKVREERKRVVGDKYERLKAHGMELHNLSPSRRCLKIYLL